MFYFSSAIAHTENVAFEWNRMGGRGERRWLIVFQWLVGWLLFEKFMKDRADSSGGDDDI